MLQKHVANALLTLQNLLKQQEILVLYSINVAWQVLCDLFHSQLLVLMVILVQLTPQFSIESDNVTALVDQLIS